MLETLTSKEVRHIAALAKAARQARDIELAKVPERDFGEPAVARGAHNPTAALGFEPLTPESAPLRALSEAVGALSTRARSELFTLLQIGRGDLALRDWGRGASQAEMMGDTAVAAALTEDPDLHDHLLKALYELKVA